MTQKIDFKVLSTHSLLKFLKTLWRYFVSYKYQKQFIEAEHLSEMHLKTNSLIYCLHYITSCSMHCFLEPTNWW